MKIQIFSDLHIDVNGDYPFSLPQKDRDTFTLIAGDVSGNVKLTKTWIDNNVHNGMFVAGNHDPCYNSLRWSIQQQKQYLHENFGVDSSVTFLDESVGVMSKIIPGTDILVIGSTLYTDYEYSTANSNNIVDINNIVDRNMQRALTSLNDFNWGHVPNEYDFRGLCMRKVSPKDYKLWFSKTFKQIKEIVESHQENNIIILTHHCPSSKCIANQFINSPINSSYVSNLDEFIISHPNIKAWCCGHVHNVTIKNIGDNGQWIICNPRGYVDLDSRYQIEPWTPHVYLDTDDWTISTKPYENPKTKKKKDKKKTKEKVD